MTCGFGHTDRGLPPPPCDVPGWRLPADMKSSETRSPVTAPSRWTSDAASGGSSCVPPPAPQSRCGQRGAGSTPIPTPVAGRRRTTRLALTGSGEGEGRPGRDSSGSGFPQRLHDHTYQLLDSVSSIVKSRLPSGYGLTLDERRERPDQRQRSRKMEMASRRCVAGDCRHSSQGVCDRPELEITVQATRSRLPRVVVARRTAR
jgi:hypothetical protein